VIEQASWQLKESNVHTLADYTNELAAGIKKFCDHARVVVVRFPTLGLFSIRKVLRVLSIPATNGYATLPKPVYASIVGHIR
jgi:hypothetical protein